MSARGTNIRAVFINLVALQKLRTKLNNTILTMFKKLFSSVVALAMVAAVLPTSVSAQTTADLQAQLAILQAQLAALQGGAAVSSAACVTFTSDLTIGSTGAQVTELQTFLVQQGHLVMPVGVAYGYFGTLTQGALASWQAANGVAPAAGYWGPISRAAYNAWCATMDNDDMMDDDDDFTPTTNDDDFDGDDEADIENFEMEDADDDEVEEGDEEVEIAQIEFDVEDAQVKFARLDLVFESTAGTEDDPWDSFERLYLELNGEIIGDWDSSDEDDWEEDDDFDADADDEYRFRISGINEILDEGDYELSILADIAGGLKGVDTTEQVWDIFVPEEGTDGALFISPNGVVQYEGENTDRAEVRLGLAGGEAELQFSKASDNPKATTLEVEDDQDKEHTVLIFEVEAEGDDVEVEKLYVTIDIATPTTSASTTIGNFSNIIDEVTLVGSGVDVDTDTSLATTGPGPDADFNGDGFLDMSLTLEFDLKDNGDDFELEEGESMELDVVVSFNGHSGNYPQGTQVRAQVTTANADATDAESHGEDLTASDISGSARGDIHALREEGLSAELTDSVEDNEEYDNGANNKAVFEMELDVTAFGEDFYIPLGATTSSATGGIKYRLENSDGSANTTATSGIITAYFTSSADDDESYGGLSYYLVEAGQTETLEITVEVTSETGFEGALKVQLEEVRYANEVGDALLTLDLQPRSEFESGIESVN